jgi:hypothetical protein
MAVQFEHFNVPGAQVVHSNSFPYGLQVRIEEGKPNTPSLEASVKAVKALSESGRFSELLQKHGAVVLKGIGHPSADSYAKVINALETARGSRPFIQIGLAGKRNIVAENIWTANEGPQDRRFYQHNEVRRPVISSGKESLHMA